MPEVSGCVPVFLNREVEHWDLELNPDMLIYKKKKDTGADMGWMGEGSVNG